MELNDCEIEIKGQKVFTRLSQKQAKAIVLIHGLIVSSRYMLPTATLLAEKYAVYAPDLPGYGQSNKPEHILSLKELADILFEWLYSLGIEKCTMLGNSFGCQLIAEFALHYPQRLEKIILQGPTVDKKARHFWPQFKRLMLDIRFERGSIIPIHLRDYWRAGPKRVIETVKMALNDRIEDKLPKIQIPSLVICGENDPLVPKAWAEEVAKLLPNGELIILKNEGHALNYSDPVELVSIIEKFVN